MSKEKSTWDCRLCPAKFKTAWKLSRHYKKVHNQ